MSHDQLTVPRPELFESRSVNKIVLGLFGVGFSCLLITLIVGLVSPEGSPLRKQFAFSYLFAFLYYFTILLGSYFWIIVHHSTDSGWGIVVRRQMENLASLLPWMILFFIPIFLVRRDIWNWITAKENPVMDPHLRDKLSYFELHFGSLVVPFFWVRTILYFAFFSITAIYFRRASIRQDSDGDPKWSVKMRGLSFPGIPLFGICTTLIAFDWFSSPDYSWASTLWGVYVFAGAAGAGMAIIILVVAGLKSAGYLGFVNEEHYHIMGQLLFVFSIFWGYIGFSQYMLIWYANIPEETEWFLRRNIESWNTLHTFLVIGRFFLPFFYLLFQFTKRRPKFLVTIAFWILAMHVIDIYIIIMPFLHQTGVEVSVMDLLALLSIGPLLAVIFLVRLGGASLFPAQDPRLPESLKLTNLVT
ncbi:MAG TPA: hypothetical protein VE860_10725 [Chthoniobacterales bacterium]|jgi:hypothetical protein|nr:hypothetical protein [Chthoniobacterales bacterium]